MYLNKHGRHRAKTFVNVMDVMKGRRGEAVQGVSPSADNFSVLRSTFVKSVSSHCTADVI
jgi:hypothetical protein